MTWQKRIFASIASSVAHSSIRAAQILLGSNRPKLLGKRLWDVYPENAGTPIEEKLPPCEGGARRLHVPPVRKSSEPTLCDYRHARFERRRPFAVVGYHRMGKFRPRKTTDQQPITHSWDCQEPSRLFEYTRTMSETIGEWGVYFADKRAADIFGIDPEPLEPVFRRFAEHIAPEDQERYITSIRESDALQERLGV